MSRRIRLGVNVDHVATIRNARGGQHPDPAHAAKIATMAGADGITFHLREDRRHITDSDLNRIREATHLPLNMEMAATEEMFSKAMEFKPETVMFVPEKREERTTEGGLNVSGECDRLKPMVEKLHGNGSRVSVFIVPIREQVDSAKDLRVDIIELHTGYFAEMLANDNHNEVRREYKRLKDMAEYAVSIGIEPQAGHGLNYHSAEQIVTIPQITELNIGHFLIGESIYVGLDSSIKTMRNVLDEVRK